MPSALVASSTAVQGWFVGLMSGTSLDGVDAVLAEFCGPRCAVLGHHAAPFDAATRAELIQQASAE